MKIERQVPRLEKRYREEVVPSLMARLGIGNPMQVPRLEKVVVNMGVGKAVENRKRLETAAEELALITGQKPVIAAARTSISAFRLREGMPIGCRVTLRRARMYEFLDRLISVVIPRIRDFRGIPTGSFDGRGNFSMGLSEQIVFPEISIDKVEFVQGMNITMVMSGRNDEWSLELLRALGMPFQRSQ